jgi:AraC family transcriptional regulator of adaptative response/methylated-DNA-[protein]-cysteine methyltransferase
MNSAILSFDAATLDESEMSHIVEGQTEDPRWHAVLARDGASDGKFVFAVSSTGVYCRPSCPSKRPRRENVTFFRQPQEAEKAGFRACLRCRPKAVSGNPRQEMIKAVCRYIEQHLDEPITLARLSAEFRQSPFHLQRTFKAVLGITPKEYANSCRMRGFRQNLKAGHSVTRAMHEAGYSSTSRLYSRTASELGMEPGKYRRGAIAAPIRYTSADSPLGRIMVAATDK